MKRIIECVANFSEGRRSDVVEEIVAAIAGHAAVTILGAESDADHNRSVVTFAGFPDSIAAAAFAGIGAAAALIDMNQQRGQHPRIGAADVIPFVPLRNVSMAECVALARSLGARVGTELRMPVFLYGEAALQERNRELALIRRGGYESLKNRMTRRLEPVPDYGPRHMGRAGGCIVGARPLLIAYNVYLTTADVSIAKAIARGIRESSGGMPYVRALGLLVKGKAQVSMNLTNYRKTSMASVFERIRKEADAFGASIASSEIIGLIPGDALSGASAAQLQITNYGPERVLEFHLDKMK